MPIGELIAYLLTPAAQIGLIIGIAELCKRLGAPAKLIPVVDLVLGIVSGVCVYGISLGYGILNGVMLGLALGLSACGLFSGIKNVAEAFADAEDDDAVG